MAPLFNIIPVTAKRSDGATHASCKDEVTMLREMLAVLDYVMHLFSVRSAPKPAEQSIDMRVLKGWFLLGFNAILLISLSVSSVVLALKGRRRFSECVEQQAECSPTTGPGRDREPVPSNCMATSKFASMHVADACSLQTIDHLWGMEVWRWLLMLALFWPLTLFGKLVTYGVALLVYVNIAGDILSFVAYGIQRQGTDVLRSGAWFGIWFAIAPRALEMASNARGWNEIAGGAVWTTDFQQVHAVVWRLLLLLLLVDIVGLISATCGRIWSLMFHHAKHFEWMRTALINEHVLQVMTQPHSIKRRVHVPCRHRIVVLEGFNGAHWATLLYLTRVIRERVHPTDVSKKIGRLRHKLARVIALDVSRHRAEEGDRLFQMRRMESVLVQRAADDEDHPGDGMESGRRSGGYDAPDTSNTREQAANLAAELLEAADCIVAGSPPSSGNDARSSGELHSSSCSSVDSNGLRRRSVRRTRRLDTYIEPAHLDHHVNAMMSPDRRPGSSKARTRLHRVARKMWAAANLALPRVPSSWRFGNSPGNSTGNIYRLHEHMQASSNLQVFKKDSSEDAADMEVITSTDAWKLGYFVFWNLRTPLVMRPMLSREDVLGAAESACIPNKAVAWKILDRNGDSCVTVDEVISSIVDVFQARKGLARSMSDSCDVVGQAQRILYIVLMAVLLFVGIGILVPGALPKVWAGISAALLSLSFVFGNSIREVFESCVFLLVSHPFDLGDIIRIEGEQYVVREMSLHRIGVTTMMGSAVNLMTHDLIHAAITNVTRSDNKWDSVSFEVDSDTTLQQCERAADHVVDTIGEHRHLFGGKYRVWVVDAGAMNKLCVTLYFDHNTCGTDLLRMGEAKTRIATALANGLRQVGVVYTDPRASVLARPPCRASDDDSQE